MVYQGNSWPKEYNGQLSWGTSTASASTWIARAERSGFIGKHGADFVNFDDRWSQVVNFLSDPTVRSISSTGMTSSNATPPRLRSR